MSMFPSGVNMDEVRQLILNKMCYEGDFDCGGPMPRSIYEYSIKRLEELADGALRTPEPEIEEEEEKPKKKNFIQRLFD